jgi:hypothetical protein
LWTQILICGLLNISGVGGWEREKPLHDPPYTFPEHNSTDWKSGRLPRGNNSYPEGKTASQGEQQLGKKQLPQGEKQLSWRKKQLPRENNKDPGGKTTSQGQQQLSGEKTASQGEKAAILEEKNSFPGGTTAILEEKTAFFGNTAPLGQQILPWANNSFPWQMTASLGKQKLSRENNSFQGYISFPG